VCETGAGDAGPDGAGANGAGEDAVCRGRRTGSGVAGASALTWGNTSVNAAARAEWSWRATGREGHAGAGDAADGTSGVAGAAAGANGAGDWRDRMRWSTP
jgi:hypothetical protein